MKKFKMITGIVCGLILSVAPVMASGIDFSGKSVDELLAIRSEVDEALFNAGGKTILYPGEYVVGQDIAAGRYTITPFSTTTERISTGYNCIIYKTKDAKAELDAATEAYVIQYYSTPEEERGKIESVKEYDYIVKQINSSNEDPATISLEEGQMMYIEWVTIFDPNIQLTIEKASGLFMD